MFKLVLRKAAVLTGTGLVMLIMVGCASSSNIPNIEPPKNLNYKQITNRMKYPETIRAHTD